MNDGALVTLNDNFSAPAMRGGRVGSLYANGRFHVNNLRTNALLRKDEWIELDTEVIRVARERLVFVSALVEAGQVFNLANAMGRTVLETQNLSEFGPASVSMDGLVRAPYDRAEFGLQSLPLPITHSDFEINLRVLEASRNVGDPLDVTQTELATRKVAEGIEDAFIGGLGFTFGGGQVFGVLNDPARVTGTFEAVGNGWANAAKTGTQILADVLAMMQDLLDINYSGPYTLVIPRAYQTKLDEDFKAETGITIRQRLLQIESLASIITADRMATDNVVLYQRTRDVMDAVIGQQPAPVQWEEEGGFKLRMKVLGIIVPRIKVSATGATGIAHYVPV